MPPVRRAAALRPTPDVERVPRFAADHRAAIEDAARC
jgi:hypothetical protein